MIDILYFVVTDFDVNTKPCTESYSSGDLGEGCASKTYINQYGTFNHSWLKVNTASDPQDCEFDNRTAIFTCKKDKKGRMFVEEMYNCKNTANTNEILQLADNTVMRSI